MQPTHAPAEHTANHPADHPAVADLPATLCPVCSYVYTAAEPCWYDACTTCGGEYTFGPSECPECAICVQAPAHDGEDGDGPVTRETSAGAAVVVTPAVTLRGAGLYLVRHGWHQGDMFTDPEAAFPAACGLGAIRMAVFGTPAMTVDTAASCEFATAVGVFTDHLVNAYGVADPSDAVTSRLGIELEQIAADWNDDPARIGSHVIAALHGAADAWDRTHRVSPPIADAFKSADIERYLTALGTYDRTGNWDTVRYACTSGGAS